jgi:hypothetical protein
MASADVAFLVDSVGDALAKGVAATTIVKPADPVEYLAHWLLRCAQEAASCRPAGCCSHCSKLHLSAQVCQGPGAPEAAPGGEGGERDAGAAARGAPMDSPSHASPSLPPAHHQPWPAPGQRRAWRPACQACPAPPHLGALGAPAARRPRQPRLSKPRWPPPPSVGQLSSSWQP